MLAPEVIPIAPAVFIWARESLGMSHEEVAKRAKRPVEEVRAWEAGGATPSFAQLERLANQVYKRPLAVFFMETPPDLPTLKQEFRTLDSAAIALLTRDTRLAIREIQARQLYLGDLFGDDNFGRSRLARLKMTINDDAAARAREVRELIGFTIDEQTNLKDSREAFNYVRQRLELQRVFTFQAPLDGIRGFALADEAFPVIGIDTADHHGARLFTLAHELAHLLLDDSDLLLTDAIDATHSQLEQYCNRFAAELLLPGEVFAEALQKEKTQRPQGELRELVVAIARRYRVSNTMVARRLLDQGEISSKDYGGLAKLFSQIHLDRKAKLKAADGGPTYYTTKWSTLGKSYIETTLSQLDRGAIDALTAAEILGVKVEKLTKLAEV